MSLLKRWKGPASGSAKEHFVVSHFDAYQDGVLAPTERAVYEQHLKTCRECREWARRQENLAAQLQMEMAPMAVLAPASAARIQQNLYSSMRRAVIMNNVRTSVAAVGALAVLALIVGAVAWWQSSGLGSGVQAPTIGEGPALSLSSQDELDEQVVQAIGQGDVAALAAALDEGADPNAESSPGRPALYLASRRGNTDAVRLLIDHGADVHAETLGGGILVSATLEGHREVVEILLDSGTDINATGTANFPDSAALHAAAEQGYRDIAELLIERGAEINQTNSIGETPLHPAVGWNRPEIVSLLLDNGADIDYQANDGWTALHVAANFNAVEPARILIETGAALNLENEDGETPLDMARPAVAELLRAAGAQGAADEATLGEIASLDQAALDEQLAEAIADRDQALLAALLEEGASPNTLDSEGNAVLALAADEGQLELVQRLLDAGADVNGTMSELGATGAINASALIQAASKSHIEVVKLLIDRGADVNQAEEQYNRTPLHGAAWNNHTEIVTILLENGADADAHSTWPRGESPGETPLHFAARNGSFEAVQALLDGGADVDTQTDIGVTPLMSPDVLPNSEMVALLLEGGSNPDKRNIYGNTALHVAAMEFLRNESIPILIAHGASIDLQNNAGDTALHNAARWNNAGAVTFLLEQGAAVNLTNEDGQTALDLATNERIIEMLRAAGAEN